MRKLRKITYNLFAVDNLDIFVTLLPTLFLLFTKKLFCWFETDKFWTGLIELHLKSKMKLFFWNTKGQIYHIIQYRIDPISLNPNFPLLILRETVDKDMKKQTFLFACTIIYSLNFTQFMLNNEGLSFVWLGVTDLSLLTCTLQIHYMKEWAQQMSLCLYLYCKRWKRQNWNTPSWVW